MNKHGRHTRNDGEQKDRQYRLRLSEKEDKILRKLSSEYGLNKAEILRRGLKIQYNSLLKMEN
jgi:hypothetical protein